MHLYIFRHDIFFLRLPGWHSDGDQGPPPAIRYEAVGGIDANGGTGCRTVRRCTVARVAEPLLGSLRSAAPWVFPAVCPAAWTVAADFPPWWSRCSCQADGTFARPLRVSIPTGIGTGRDAADIPIAAIFD